MPSIRHLKKAFFSRIKFYAYCIKYPKKILPLLPDYFLLKASPLFDTAFYLKNNPEAHASLLPPVLYYLYKGQSDWVNPNSKFDFLEYLHSNLDVLVSGMDPLVHYLRHGEKEKRNLPLLKIREIPSVKAPTPTDWAEYIDAYANRPINSKVPRITIVIPVYSGYDETLNCIFSVIKSLIDTNFHCRVVVIDDKSPEPELSKALDLLASLGFIELIKNEQNLGFVASVNKGMKAHLENDVVLLNSDTEVYGNWVERLQQNVYSSHDIGTATPFSNNATICSYPSFCQDYPYSYGVEFTEVDALSSQVNANRIIDIPTGVGFCMYIKRDCLNEVGLFDYESFGHGYGEECDFCQRAWKKNWRSILCTDVFVRHLGSVSFGNKRSLKVQNATRVLRELHPNYESDVATFCLTDPIRPYREKMDLAILSHRYGRRKFILHITHLWGGGTEQHVTDMCDALTNQGVICIIGTPGTTRKKMQLSLPKLEWASNLPEIDLTQPPEVNAAVFKSIGIEHIHIHHTIGFEFSFPETLRQIAQAANLPYDYTTHDYYCICPRINMIDETEIYCNSRNLQKCNICLSELGSMDVTVTSIVQWRNMYGDFMSSARKIFVPDKDIIPRLNNYFPALDFTVRKHLEIHLPDQLGTPERQPNKPLRVAIIGRIGLPKGSKILTACAIEACEANRPLHFFAIGTSPKNARFNAFSYITPLGEYHLSNLTNILRIANCHIAFFPAVWPETYSYTLSQALAAGLYPVCFDIGAPARRLKELNWGTVIPTSLWNNPKQINKLLLSLKNTPPPPNLNEYLGGQYTDMLADYYNL